MGLKLMSHDDVIVSLYLLLGPDFLEFLPDRELNEGEGDLTHHRRHVPDDANQAIQQSRTRRETRIGPESEDM